MFRLSLGIKTYLNKTLVFCCMKIAFFEMEKKHQEYVRERLKEHTLYFFEDVLSLEHVDSLKDIDVLSVFIYSQVSKEVIDRFSSLKMVCTRSTGFDHVDVEYCKEKGISFYNVPKYGDITVAEHVFALLLCLSRKIISCDSRVKGGDFSHDSSLRGFDLYGKTLGIVGMGGIGKHTCRIAKGFGMDVVAYDVFEDERISKELGFRYVSLEKLFGLSDVISLHVPYMPQTHHMINDESIAMMKEGVILINTARGGLVDTSGLVKGLKSGKIAGAGLDVLENEKVLAKGDDILGFDNVVITPHNAYNSYEALRRILDCTVDNVRKME